MKLIKIEAYVVDHDERGPEVVAALLRHCYIGATRVEAQEAEIGEWDDSHILNMNSTTIDEFRKQFQGTATGHPEDEAKLKTPTGEQLYMTVCRNFKNGHFAWDVVPEQTKNAWTNAAADLLFSPDTIMGKHA